MELVNVSKSYNDKLIFTNLNYTFHNGNVYWIQGKNGVGKSTLIRLLIGMEAPDTGNIKDRSLSTLYIPEIPLTEDWLTAAENITFLYKISHLKSPTNIDWEKCLSIKEEDMTSLCMNCSLGTNMKISFSLIFTETQLQLIVIDEAFSHLDQEAQLRLMKKLILYSKEHNSTVIFTHHDSLKTDEEIITNINELLLTKEGIYGK